MLEEISQDRSDQLSLPVNPGARPLVEILPGGVAPPLPMPATSPPASGQHCQHSEEAPESIEDSPLTSLSLSAHYLYPITLTSPRSEAGYEDTIMLAPLVGANTATGNPARAGSTLVKTSRAFAAWSDSERQSYTEAMADSPKWCAATKSELDSHIENGTWEVAELPPGRCEISSKWVFKTKVNANSFLH